MDRAILLVDSACGPCSAIGRQIAAEGLLEDSIVELGSLQDEHLRKEVYSIRPDARWEPTLLRTGGDSPAVHTGLRLAVELTALLGPRRAFRISQLVRETIADEDTANDSRRSFLLKFAATAAAIPLMSAGGLALSQQTVRASDPLTPEEVERAYNTVLRSSRFKRVRRAARSEGFRHRRDHSEPNRAVGNGFAADTYGGSLPDGEDRAIIILILTYTDSSGTRSQNRWIQAVVDRQQNRLLSVVDVDASAVEPGEVVSRMPDNARRGAAVPLAATAPAGSIRFSDGSSPISINNGTWSGTALGGILGQNLGQGNVTRAPTPGCLEQLVCGLTGVLACAPVCGLLSWFFVIPGIVCGVVCSIVWIVTCWYVPCT